MKPDERPLPSAAHLPRRLPLPAPQSRLTDPRSDGGDGDVDRRIWPKRPRDTKGNGSEVPMDGESRRRLLCAVLQEVLEMLDEDAIFEGAVATAASEA